MRSLLAYPTRTLSRRAFLSSVLATAIGGSAIAGFVVRGTPRLMVVGEEEWQIALLLVARTRVLILNGDPTPNSLEVIPMLLSVMRQRIDVVIGSSIALASLPSGFRKRWMVRRFIPLPDERGTVAGLTAPDRILHIPGDVHVRISASPRGFWSGSSSGVARSATAIVSITCRECIITIGRTLEAIADLGSSSTTVAIAPNGSIDYLARHLRVPTICINADKVREQTMGVGARALVPPVSRSLVRIFPQDVAEFGLQAQGIAIPSWRQTFPHV